jgi:FKBP-type peptidyl-prolyl cis-trans isomerase FklB
VYKLPSGMLFKVLSKGKGDLSPRADDPCEVHYSGTLRDGKKFDSSYDRGAPATFKPTQVIKGWTEALQLMREGDKWEVYIPYNLAYGEHGSPPRIPGYSPLVFQMELLKVKSGGKPASDADAAIKAAIGKDYADL